MSISVSGSGPSITVDGSGSTIAVTVTTGGGSSGGVTDHGALTGLSDDDHSLYALADGSRGDFEESGAVSTHSADTTSVHGIADTSALVDTSNVRLPPTPVGETDDYVVKVSSDAFVIGAAPSGGGDVGVPVMDAPVGETQIASLAFDDQSGHTVGSTTLGSLSAMTAMPIMNRRDTTYDRVDVYCTTAGTDAGVLAEIGYCPAAADGGPDYAAMVKFGEVALNSTGLKSIALSPEVTLEAGQWWIAIAPRTDGTSAGTNPALMGLKLAGATAAGNLGATATFAKVPLISRSNNDPVTAGTAVILQNANEYTAPRVGLRVSGYPT